MSAGIKDPSYVRSSTRRMLAADPQETHDCVSLNSRNVAYCGPPVEIVGRQYQAVC